MQRITTTGILRPTAADDLAALSIENRHRLADKFADVPEATWRQWIPEPFSPIDLRLSPLELMDSHGPSCDFYALGHKRGSALAEFIAEGSEQEPRRATTSTG